MILCNYLKGSYRDCRNKFLIVSDDEQGEMANNRSWEIQTAQTRMWEQSKLNNCPRDAVQFMVVFKN